MALTPKILLFDEDGPSIGSTIAMLLLDDENNYVAGLVMRCRACISSLSAAREFRRGNFFRCVDCILRI